jgi:uncharacterized phage protein (TIGR01671 family)
MEREIKFRAWDGKRMTTSGIMFNCSTGFLETPIGAQMKLMQYTGLKDKNGKEIYEGDIVFWDYEKIVVSYGIQGVDAFEGVGFNLWGHYGQKQDGTRIQSEMEVVGNIYENPELL